MSGSPADPATSSRVLVVEDDQAVGQGLVGLLAADGYDVVWAQLGEQARRLVAAGPVDLVLLDLGLPDVSGLDLCRDLREVSSDLVIVVVTARTDEAEAVALLDSGADDFVAKPFRSAELQARVRAHLRRRDLEGREEVRSGRLRIDVRARRAWFAETELSLRPKEHELLIELVLAAGQAVRRELIMDHVWDANWRGSTKTLDVHIGNLRRKLADAGDRWDRIATLRGFGYRFEVDDGRSSATRG